MKCATCHKVRATGVISGYDGETTYCSLACAGISRAHLATRYYLFDTYKHEPTSHGLFADLRTVCTEIKYFRNGVGQVYAMIKGVFNDDKKVEGDDVLSIIAKYQTICPGMLLVRKPKPERYWKGTWINFYQIQKHYEKRERLHS